MRLGSVRRALVRPKSSAAVQLLRRGDLPAEEDLEVYRIPPDTYETYFHVFNDLDRTCGIAGDDFETEEVEDDRMPCLLKTLKTYSRSNDKVLDEMIDRMWGLCYRADKEKMPVFFVL